MIALILKHTWEVVSKWRMSRASAETPPVAWDTLWEPSDSESPAMVGLQHWWYRNLRAFPILEFSQFQPFVWLEFDKVWSFGRNGKKKQIKKEKQSTDLICFCQVKDLVLEQDEDRETAERKTGQVACSDLTQRDLLRSCPCLLFGKRWKLIVNDLTYLVGDAALPSCNRRKGFFGYVYDWICTCSIPNFHKSCHENIKMNILPKQTIFLIIIINLTNN